MGIQDKGKILDSLSKSISEKNTEKTVDSLIDFIMTYLPNSEDPKDVELKKHTLDTEFGLIKGTFIGIMMNRQESVRRLLKYFEEKGNSPYLFNLKRDGIEVNLYFDKNNNTVSVPDLNSSYSEVKQRFVKTYGSETVHLNISKDKK